MRYIVYVYTVYKLYRKESITYIIIKEERERKGAWGGGEGIIIYMLSYIPKEKR